MPDPSTPRMVTLDDLNRQPPARHDDHDPTHPISDYPLPTSTAPEECDRIPAQPPQRSAPEKANGRRRALKGSPPTNPLSVDAHNWISVNESAKMVQVSRRTIYNWLNSGKLEYVRTAGGSIRISPASLWEEDTHAPRGRQR